MTLNEYVEILRQCGCFDFLRTQAASTADEIMLGSPGGANLLSDEATEALKTGLCRRMEPVYVQPMTLRLREIIMEISPAEGINLSQAGRDTVERGAKRMAELMGTGIGTELEEAYPLIRDYTSRIQRNYITAQAEMLYNIADHKQEISNRLFDGRTIDRIQTISIDCGDPHRHGRTVQRIVTDAGAFYYKPHDCRLDALYKDMVKAVLPECTLAPTVVCGNACGFEEELISQELESSEQISEYFYNFGMLTALFHALGSTDMHGENIMACGIYPSAIDLETLIKGRVSKAAITAQPRRSPFTPVEDDFEYCVGKIGILPNTILRGLFFSALHRDSGSHLSLPKCQGEEIEIIGYEKDYIQGFREGYDRILVKRDRLKELTHEAADMSCRYITKNTTYYYYLRSSLYEAEAMKDAAGRDAVLKRLEVPYTERNIPVAREVVNYEARCLCEGDFPYFCAAAGSHDLCGEDTEHVLISEYWSESAEEVMYTHMERLSPKERDFEADYIIKRLYHAPLFEEKSVECTELPAEALSEEDTRSVCKMLLRELEADGVRTACGTTVWHSGTHDIEEDPAYAFITHFAEAALFCAMILSDPSLLSLYDDAARIAGPCMEQLLLYAERLEGESPEYLRSAIPLGIGSGMGGILLTVEAAARAGMTGAEKLAERFLKIICQNHMYRDRLKRGGEAGLIIAASILSVSAESESEITQLMTGCADEILERAPSDSPLTEAMLGAALSKAFCLTGDEQYKRAAYEAFQHVGEAYLPHISGWPETKPEIAWLADSAGQEGGIALCAMIAADAPDMDPAVKVRDLGLTALRESQHLSRSDSLYNGNALRVLGLTRAAEKAGRKEDLECAGRILSGMVLRRGQNGCFICSPEGVRSFFDVSVSRGTLGVGYAALSYLRAWNSIAGRER